MAQSGRKDNVTIATNMAGRGTDILLRQRRAWPASNLAEEVAEKVPGREEISMMPSSSISST